VGLGTSMLQRLADIAHELGLTQLTATYYADNMAIRRLLRRTGPQLPIQRPLAAILPARQGHRQRPP